MELNVVRTYNSENSAVPTQCTFFGCPERTSHIVIGDSHLLRIASLNMARFPGYKEATKGLVLIHMGGGMVKLRAIARQLVRGIYIEHQGSFDDMTNTIAISIALGYNDVDKNLEEYFHSALSSLMTFKHILAEVQATWSVHLAEVPYGLEEFHSNTTRINYVANQINRLLGPQVPLRLWTAQTGVDKSEDFLEEINCDHVHIMVEQDMMDPQDYTGWHVKPEFMENMRDVIFEWAGGAARNSSIYPIDHTYVELAEFEISLRQRTVIQGEDYFQLRQERLRQAYDHPLDLTAIREAESFPAPSMRLQQLKEFLRPRPDYYQESDDGRDHHRPIHQRLGRRGRRGRGGRGGRGGHDRSAPYQKNGGKGRKGGR